jgi:hypothetical protein
LIACKVTIDAAGAGVTPVVDAAGGVPAFAASAAKARAQRGSRTARSQRAVFLRRDLFSFVDGWSWSIDRTQNPFPLRRTASAAA